MCGISLIQLESHRSPMKKSIDSWPLSQSLHMIENSHSLWSFRHQKNLPTASCLRKPPHSLRMGQRYQSVLAHPGGLPTNSGVDSQKIWKLDYLKITCSTFPSRCHQALLQPHLLPTAPVSWNFQFACYFSSLFVFFSPHLMTLSNFAVLSASVSKRPALWARRRRPNGKKCQREEFKKNIRNWEMLGRTDLPFSGMCLSKKDHPLILPSVLPLAHVNYS